MATMNQGLTTADLAGLSRWVKEHSAGAIVPLAFSQAKALLDEMKRLQQSSELLRKQNKKLRLRLSGLGVPPDAADGDGEPVPDV